MSEHHFYHGDFGWNVDDDGIVEWDGEGEYGPSDADADAAEAHWSEDGYNEYMSDLADEIGDYQYEMMREARWED